MTRDRQNENDLALVVKRLMERVALLERQLRAQSTSVRSGRIALVDSTLTMTDSPDGVGEGTRGRITLNRYGAEDDEGYSFHVDRAVGIGGHMACNIATVDGGINGESSFPTIVFYDKKGGETVVADADRHRRGMADPRLQVPWYKWPSELESSTSATFAEIAGFKWYAYHPHLRVELIVQNDASTVSEVEIRDPFGNLFSQETFPGGTNTFVDMPAIRREDLINDFDGVNGNPTYMVVSHRRVSGAGTVRAMVVNVVAMDLSIFD